MITKILALDGLNDAKLCALTEQLLRTIPGVISINIDFISQKLTLCTEEKDLSDVLERMVILLERTIPGITVRRLDVSDLQEGDVDIRVSEKDESASFMSALPEPEKKRAHPFMAMDADIILCGVGLVLSGLFLLLCIPFKEADSLIMLFCGISLALSALFTLLSKLGRQRNYLSLTLCTLAVSATALLLGNRIEGAAIMLLYHLSVLVAATMDAFLAGELEKLIPISPKEVNRLFEGASEQIPLGLIVPGDQIVIKGGETIPFDGVIRQGDSTLDISLLAGEPARERVQEGDRVRCGDTNMEAPLTVEVTDSQEYAVAAKLRHILTRPQSGESISVVQTQKWVRICGLLGIAGVAICLLLLYDKNNIQQWLYPCLTCLLLAAPCGTSEAIRNFNRSMIARAAKRGIMIRSSRFLDEAARIKTIVLGYTGVLTQGLFRVSAVRAPGPGGEKELLELAAYAEHTSTHPIAHAIREKYEKSGGKALDTNRASANENVPGYGGRVMLDRRVVMVGSEKYMREAGVEVPANTTGEMRVYVSLRGEYMGTLVLGDAMRSESVSLLKTLHGAGVEKVVLMTGCDSAVALVAGTAIGADEVFSEKTGNEKRDTLLMLLNREGKNGNLLFAGKADDTPLCEGICTSIAVDDRALEQSELCADVVIPSGRLEKLAEAVQISRSGVGFAILMLVLFWVGKVVLAVCAGFWGMPLYGIAIGNAVIAMLGAMLGVRLLWKL